MVSSILWSRLAGRDASLIDVLRGAIIFLPVKREGCADEPKTTSDVATLTHNVIGREQRQMFSLLSTMSV
jgi:hypothetical protein